MESSQDCIRCGSADYLEAVRKVREFEKDGKQLTEYQVRCNKCGRIDPYITDKPNLIDPRTALRLDLALEGEQKQVIAARVNPSSDQFGAPNPLDADYEARKNAGLL